MNQSINQPIRKQALSTSLQVAPSFFYLLPPNEQVISALSSHACLKVERWMGGRWGQKQCRCKSSSGNSAGPGPRPERKHPCSVLSGAWAMRWGDPTGFTWWVGMILSAPLADGPRSDGRVCSFKLGTWNSFLKKWLHLRVSAMIHLKPIQVCFPSALQKMMPGRSSATALWDLSCFLVVVMVGGDGRWHEGTQTSHWEDTASRLGIFWVSYSWLSRECRGKKVNVKAKFLKSSNLGTLARCG